MARGEVHGEYEQIRLARMEENRKRMMELGLTDLSESIFAKDSRRRAPKRASLPRSAEPARRSARLQSCPAPSYREIREPLVRERSERARRRTATLAGTGGRIPEIYTEEHEKLLGNATKEWVLFQDGYKGRERVYDPMKGKTCHQCRQKTMGLRTSCSECNMVQGQFCGDCLYMRYGENVEEALEDENWKCPVCRDICNCSICRSRKGWAPTGTLYRTAIHMGYKSVAHFLILTRRGGDTPLSPSLDHSPSEEDAAAKRHLEFGPCSDGRNQVSDTSSLEEIGQETKAGGSSERKGGKRKSKTISEESLDSAEEPADYMNEQKDVCAELANRRKTRASKVEARKEQDVQVGKTKAVQTRRQKAMEQEAPVEAKENGEAKMTRRSLKLVNANGSAGKQLQTRGCKSNKVLKKREATDQLIIISDSDGDADASAFDESIAHRLSRRRVQAKM